MSRSTRSVLAPVFLFAASAVSLSTGSFAQSPKLEKDISRTVSDHLGGSGESFVMKSNLLGQTRRMNIATPASYESTGKDRRYPVIIAFDGEYSFGYTNAAAQYLAEAGQIPEALVVAIENAGGPDGRVHDLTPPGLSVSGSTMNEGGDRFLDFIEKELTPAMAEQFRAGPPNVLIGHSNGGILVTYAAATRTASSPFVVAIDSPTHFQDGWLMNRLIDATHKSPSSFLRYASLESRFGWSDKSWDALKAAAPAGWKVYREKLEHETHNTMPLLATYVGLREVFADYSMLKAPDSPTSAALEHYRKFNASSGLALIPPSELLSRTIEDLLMEGRADLAQEAFQMWVAAYGETPAANSIRAKIEEAAKEPPLAVTVEDLLRHPMPDAKEIAPFVGEWNGLSKINDGNFRESVRLQIEIKNGKASGAWINWPAPDTELVMPLEYLNVVGGGLHFGFMNGMRPRGMIMYECTLRDGKLEGEMHMRGIRFKYPDGISPPRVQISLQRTKTGTE